jgi:hypothetical protein
MTDLSNNPRPIDLLREKVEALAAAAKQWETAEITVGETASRAQDFDQQLFAILKEVEAAHQAERKPHRAALDALSAAWKPLEDAMTAGRAMIAEKLKPYLRAHGSVRGAISGVLRSQRKVWRAIEITDMDEFCTWLNQHYPLILRDMLMHRAASFVREGTHEIPGVKIEEVEA